MIASVGREGDRAAVRSLTFDDVVATYLVDGVLTMRPKRFFPAIPAEHWSQRPDLLTPAGGLQMSAGGLLVDTGDVTLLIDAGVGPLTTDLGIGSVDCGSMVDVLLAIGRRPEDIDILAFTHLHFDHAGWAFVDGAATFPNARYVLAAHEWAPYADRRRGTDVSTPWHVVAALAAHPDVTLVGDGEVVAPGVCAVVTPGHTPGHASYVITSRVGRRLIVFGDAFHTTAQLAHPDWLSMAESDPASVPVARRRLIAELSDPDTIGFGFHFGDRPFGRVVPGADGEPVWDPVPTAVSAPPPR